MSISLITTLVKIFLACFPFLRELFLGDPKKNPRLNGKRNPRQHILFKKILIASALAATLMCFYLSYQLFDVSWKYHKLLKENKEVAKPTIPVPEPPVVAVSAPEVAPSAPSRPVKKTIRSRQPIHESPDQLKKLQEIEKCTQCDTLRSN